MLLFLKTDIYEAFEKLRECVGSIIFKGQKTVECIWFSGLKFELCNDVITIKDMGYGDYIQARVVCNEAYIDKISALILNAPCDLLRAYKKGIHTEKKYASGRVRSYYIYKDFFKERLRNVSKFKERNFLTMDEDEVQRFMKDIRKLKIKEVAAKYNVSEHFVKKIYYQK